MAEDRTPEFPIDARFAHLDPGERDAIALALQLKADLVLIDESDARAAAQKCGLAVAGTPRVLASAASLSLVDLPEAFARLRQTSFRAHPNLFEDLLAQDGVRRE